MHAKAQLVAVVDERLHRFAEGLEERRFHGAAVEHMGVLVNGRSSRGGLLIEFANIQAPEIALTQTMLLKPKTETA